MTALTNLRKCSVIGGKWSVTFVTQDCMVNTMHVGQMMHLVWGLYRVS